MRLEQSEATKAPENKSREDLVIGTIRRIEVPFMQALQKEYGEKRGWRICGPASIALTRVLTTLTGVPIQQGGEGERLELSVGIYDPKSDPDRRTKTEEQTYVRYYTGKGDVYYIDPIYGLLMGGRTDLDGAIQVEKYKQEDLDEALANNHDLYSFDPDHEYIDYAGTFSTLPASIRGRFYNDTLSALHDFRATMQYFIADSGDTFKTDWNKTEAVIMAIAPDWQPDFESMVLMNEILLSNLDANRPKPTSVSQIKKLDNPLFIAKRKRSILRGGKIGEKIILKHDLLFTNDRVQ